MEVRVKRSDELYHYGVKGMKWGVRKDAGRSLLSDVKSSAKTMAEHLTKDKDAMTKRADSRDAMAIQYDTKNMTDRQKKIYELNYYNDRKTATKFNRDSVQATLNNLNNPNKSRSDQLAIDILGANYMKDIGNMQLKAAETMYGHYSKKVDTMLNNMGDIKLSTVKSMRIVRDGNTTYSWYGDEYVEA